MANTKLNQTKPRAQDTCHQNDTGTRGLRDEFCLREAWVGKSLQETVVLEPGLELWVEFGLAEMQVEKGCFWEREQAEQRHKGEEILDRVLGVKCCSVLLKWSMHRCEQLERCLGTYLFMKRFPGVSSGAGGEQWMC